MTAMTPDLEPWVLRDLIHGTRLILSTLRSQYKGDLEGFDTIMDRAQRVIDGEEDEPKWGSWGLVSDGTPEGRADPIRNAVANLGDACAYALEGSSVAVDHVRVALGYAVAAGVSLDLIETMAQYRYFLIAKNRHRPMPVDENGEEDWDAWEAALEEKVLLRNGFLQFWWQFRAQLQAQDTPRPANA